MGGRSSRSRIHAQPPSSRPHHPAGRSSSIAARRRRGRAGRRYNCSLPASSSSPAGSGGPHRRRWARRRGDGVDATPLLRRCSLIPTPFHEPVPRSRRAASSSHEQGVRGLREAILRGRGLPLPQVHRCLCPRWRLNLRREGSKSCSRSSPAWRKLNRCKLDTRTACRRLHVLAVLLACWRSPVMKPGVACLLEIACTRGAA
ncbi:uncharacterized protein LOC120673655 isoform X1 [Panicum virgatum]|uniref:uncharacterized protein LOC120673655 isoform X1 n=1 Tax=Panicum virgatum TaxID=38727 RepID=UPI0019D54DD3|nr:uncharacterized protein LOC120673655 isoform X1 [Panicum virgatum]